MEDMEKVIQKEISGSNNDWSVNYGLSTCVFFFSPLPFLYPHKRWMTDVVWLLEWSGINALLYYGPTLVHSIGLRGDTVTLLVSGGISVVQFLAVLPAIIFIDRLGKFFLYLFFLLFFFGLIWCCRWLGRKPLLRGNFRIGIIIVG